MIKQEPKRTDWYSRIRDGLDVLCVFACVCVCLCVCVHLSHSDLGCFVESVNPVHEILLVIGLQEELPHPSIDD